MTNQDLPKGVIAFPSRIGSQSRINAVRIADSTMDLIDSLSPEAVQDAVRRQEMQRLVSQVQFARLKLINLAPDKGWVARFFETEAEEATMAAEAVGIAL
jgi:hypothetical protein